LSSAIGPLSFVIFKRIDGFAETLNPPVMSNTVPPYLALRSLSLLVSENLILTACLLAAVQIRLFTSAGELQRYEHPIFKAFLISLVFQAVLHLLDIYIFSKTATHGEFFARLGAALLCAATLLSLIFYNLPDFVAGRGILLTALLLGSIFLTLWHTLLRVYIGTRAPRIRILVVGTGHLARELVREVIRHPELDIKVCGFVDSNPQLLGVSLVNPKVIGLVKDLSALVSQHKASKVIVEMQDRRGCLPTSELLKLKIRGISIDDATTLYERLTGKIAIENLKPSWMIFNSGFEVSGRLLLVKQIVATFVSLLLLILFSPIMLLVMGLIKLESLGPIFFKQERVGRDGKLFTLWKFRSMRADAERESGPVWAEENDNRVTRLGKFLRRTRLDEVPQLWNVLRGDMSLVGPRPERPFFVNQLAEKVPFYQLRHTVKPGVTGWAQINYHYGNSFQDSVEKLQFDLFYLKHMSVFLDLLIIIETIKTVLVRKGS